MYCNSRHSRLGLTAARVASQAIAAILFGVSRLDTDTYLGVIAGGGASMASCVSRSGERREDRLAWSHEETRIDPSVAGSCSHSCSGLLGNREVMAAPNFLENESSSGPRSFSEYRSVDPAPALRLVCCVRNIHML
jgi:hypothetical protein